jgi:DNA-directed RNA polymerase subunit M/transcription elongation factor TFIIS
VVDDDEINFTKTRAFQFLELKTFEGERPVRERHVQFLYDEWVSGRFLWQNIMLASARMPNGDEFRINGQHTCWMRVAIDERYEPVQAAVVRAMVYQVKDEAGLRHLYSAFDRGAPRTVAHVGKVLLIGSRCTDGVPPSMINAMIAGFKVYLSPNRIKRDSIPIDELASMIEAKHGVNFNLVARYSTQHLSESKLVKRASVLGAMLATFEKNVQASDDFWTPVFNGLSLDKKTDPRYALRKFLEKHGNLSAWQKPTMEHSSQEEMFCTCLSCWNHWRTGSEVTVLKPSVMRPKIKP